MPAFPQTKIKDVFCVWLLNSNWIKLPHIQERKKTTNRFVFKLINSIDLYTVCLFYNLFIRFVSNHNQYQMCEKHIMWVTLQTYKLWNREVKRSISSLYARGDWISSIQFQGWLRRTQETPTNFIRTLK